MKQAKFQRPLRLFNQLDHNIVVMFVALFHYTEWNNLSNKNLLVIKNNLMCKYSISQLRTKFGKIMYKVTKKTDYLNQLKFHTSMDKILSVKYDIALSDSIQNELLKVIIEYKKLDIKYSILEFCSEQIHNFDARYLTYLLCDILIQNIASVDDKYITNLFTIMIFDVVGYLDVSIFEKYLDKDNTLDEETYKIFDTHF